MLSLDGVYFVFFLFSLFFFLVIDRRLGMRGNATSAREFYSMFDEPWIRLLRGCLCNITLL